MNLKISCGIFLGLQTSFYILPKYLTVKVSMHKHKHKHTHTYILSPPHNLYFVRITPLLKILFDTFAMLYIHPIQYYPVVLFKDGRWFFISSFSPWIIRCMAKYLLLQKYLLHQYPQFQCLVFIMRLTFVATVIMIVCFRRF